MGTHPIFESDFDCLTELAEMGRTIRTCRKGAGGIFKAVQRTRKGAAKYRSLDYAERHGYIKGVVKDIIHDPGRGAPLCKVQFQDPYKYGKDNELFVAAEGTSTGHSSTPERRPNSTSETSCPSATCPKVLHAAVSSPRSVTEVSSPRAPESPVSSSPTTPTLARPESSSHLAPRRSLTLDAELPSVSSPVVDVSTSPSSRLAEPTTSTRLSVTAGLRFVVLL